VILHSSFYILHYLDAVQAESALVLIKATVSDEVFCLPALLDAVRLDDASGGALMRVGVDDFERRVGGDGAFDLGEYLAVDRCGQRGIGRGGPCARFEQARGGFGGEVGGEAAIARREALLHVEHNRIRNAVSGRKAIGEQMAHADGKEQVGKRRVIEAMIGRMDVWE